MRSLARNLLAEFKAFATAGTMIDLALGIVIGAAFSRVVESLARDVITDLIAALGGSTSTDELAVSFHGGSVHYGRFVSALIGFVIIAFSLFAFIKLLRYLGILRFRTTGQVECEYCLGYVPIEARRCRHCGSDITPAVP
jgi:large conductance mechanosensitive channel